MIFVRKVVRGSKDRFDYSLNFPKEVVEKLDLVGATVKITIQNGKLIITKNVDDSDDTPKKVKTSSTTSPKEEPYDLGDTIHR